MKQYEIVVSGRVQGVGYRYFVHQKAIEMGLNGWVRNHVDGSVIVMVQGEDPVINTFIDFLQIGPVRARVDRITKIKMDILSEFDSFRVK